MFTYIITISAIIIAMLGILLAIACCKISQQCEDSEFGIVRMTFRKFKDDYTQHSEKFVLYDHNVYVYVGPLAELAKMETVPMYKIAFTSEDQKKYEAWFKSDSWHIAKNTNK